MCVAVVAENVRVDRYGVDDRKRGDQDQKIYPLSGPEEKEQTEPGGNDQRIAHQEREMQRIANGLNASVT
jgi:hypothetical protein